VDVHLGDGHLGHVDQLAFGPQGLCYARSPLGGPGRGPGDRAAGV
jgi:hypothetical protein